MDDAEAILSSRHYGTGAHMNAQRLWQHTQELHKFKPERVSAPQEESGPKTCS